jgi:hypothetical protein
VVEKEDLVAHRMESLVVLVVELLEEIQMVEQLVQVIHHLLVHLKETMVVLTLNPILLIMVQAVEELLQQVNLLNQVTLVLVVEVLVQQVV